jgi:hypothetical protein
LDVREERGPQEKRPDRAEDDCHKAQHEQLSPRLAACFDELGHVAPPGFFCNLEADSTRLTCHASVEAAPQLEESMVSVLVLPRNGFGVK